MILSMALFHNRLELIQFPRTAKSHGQRAAERRDRAAKQRVRAAKQRARAAEWRAVSVGHISMVGQ